MEVLEDLGWLGRDVWLAHCVHLSDADIATPARTGSSVAHCPSSNARLGAGTARARDLLAAGGDGGGAACLGRQDEIGSIEVGKRADLTVWDLRGLGHADLDDPVVALVIGPTPPLRWSTVEGRVVVEDGELRTTSVERAVADLVAARQRLLRRA